MVWVEWHTSRVLIRVRPEAGHGHESGAYSVIVRAIVRVL